MKKFFIFTLISSTALFGCSKSSEPKLDATNMETLSQSIMQMSSALPDQKKDDLQKAISIIMLSDIEEMSKAIMDNKMEENADLKDLYLITAKKINGMTAEQIITYANKLNRKL